MRDASAPSPAPAPRLVLGTFVLGCWGRWALTRWGDICSHTEDVPAVYSQHLIYKLFLLLLSNSHKPKK